MKVLLTGADGYIGVRMGHVLLERGHDVTGLDSGFHRVGWLYNSDERRPTLITKDTRHITVEDLQGYDALVHLAEVSNDPVGELNQDVTYNINHHGSLRLATLAKEAGIERFVHMSSCSVYGASGDKPSKEGDPTEPLTSYAKCKVLIEQDVAPLADDNFSPTFMRNATAFGASPRQRFDLVVNDLAATAYLDHEIRMASDGTPWRPFVHILDISHAVACVLDAPRDVVHNEIFNVGSNEGNYQVRQVAEIIGSLVPGCELIFGDSSADKRNYRADFTKIHEQLPGFQCSWDVERGAKDILDIFARIGFDEELYRFRGHTRIKQIKHLLGTAQIDDDFFWDVSVVPKVDVAITTWNRRDSVVPAIASALAQDVDGMRVVVYDNGSTDGTPELCRDEFGEQIVYRRWEENRGRHANMTRAFTESDADHLIMVFDDEELLPGAIAAMVQRAGDDPTAAFVAGRFRYRDADGTTMRESSLQAPVDFRPPARLEGNDFIRMAYRSGVWTWVCSVMFNRHVVGVTKVLERDTPCDDAGLLLRSAMLGPILYLDRATTTKTDGNLGESIRDGLTEAETLEARNVIRLSGILGFRHTLEKFLFFEANDHFTATERRAMLRDLDNFCASLLGDRLADVRKVSAETKVRQELRESLDLVHSIRARTRLIRRSLRQGRPR